MKISYKPLWHTLLDKDMNKAKLEEVVGLTHYMVNLLSRDKAVSLAVILKICEQLNVDINDIVEFVDD